MRIPADKPASQGPQLAEETAGDRNLLASLPNMKVARQAIEELGRAGIEGQRVSLRGPAPDEAAEQLEYQTRADNARTDSELVGRWASRVIAGAAVGAVVGAVLGIPIGILAVELIDEDVTLTTVIASAFLGALFLSTIFGLVSHVYQLPGQGQAWELTFHDTGEQRVVVEVTSAESHDIEASRRVLEGLGATDIRTVAAGESSQEAVESMSRRG